MSTAINENKVKEYIGKLLSLQSVKNSTYVSDELKSISGRLEDETFRIAVVGEFSSGKSTFINAVIGKDVLSHARLETTAAITYIRNVSKDDARCNTCIVSFRDGTEKKLDELDEISTYTTVQSNNKVAERISSVTIYVNFLDSKLPVMIVDTPGLNGTAEHHREITIEEIKKAHTCIYLLSSSGISNPDIAFINLLRDYQDTFLFLQNFIDDLSSLEGDTAESKTAEDDRIIKEKIISNGKSIKYNVIGISALKALVSRDKSINKLYSKDTRTVSDSDRPRLYKESNFSEFEAYLRDMITSGEYKNVILESVKRRLIIILESLLTHLDEEQKINEKLCSQDDDNHRVLEAQQALEKISSRSEDRERKLRNFVKSTADRQLKTAINYSKNMLQTIYDDICADLDKKIQTFNDFQNFTSLYGSSHSVYYSRLITEMVKKTSVNVFDTAGSLLNHVYEQALDRIETYTSRKVSSEPFRFSLNALDDTFVMEASASLGMIDEFEKSVEALKNKKNYLNDNIRNQEVNLKSAVMVVNDINQKIRNCEKERQSALNLLGRRPDVKRWTTSETVYVSRDGFFGPLIDNLCGMKTRTKYHEHTDDTKGMEYDRKKSSINSDFMKRGKELRAQLAEASGNVESIRETIEHANKDIRKTETDIDFLKEQIEVQKEIYANEVKLKQQKFCDLKKQELKSGIDLILSNEAEPSSAVSKFVGSIQKMYEYNEPFIENKSVEMLKKAMEEQKNVFETMIKENTAKLEERYACNSDDIEAISHIYSELVPGFDD